MFEERIPCITTTDNPFNPFTEYDQWETVDCKKGYYTAYTLHEQVEWYERYLQMTKDRYFIDFGKAVVLGMMNMVCQDEKRKKKGDLKQILPRSVHYRIIWKDEEPE